MDVDWDDWIDMLGRARKTPANVLSVLKEMNNITPFQSNKSTNDLIFSLTLMHDHDVSKWFFDRVPRHPVSVWRRHWLPSGALESLALDSNLKFPLRSFRCYEPKYDLMRQQNKVAALFGAPGKKRRKNTTSKFVAADGDHACMTRVLGFLLVSEAPIRSLVDYD